MRERLGHLWCVRVRLRLRLRLRVRVRIRVRVRVRERLGHQPDLHRQRARGRQYERARVAWLG